MNFIISSSELSSHLQSISKVITTKSPLPILDHFLFQVKDSILTITASDLESTLITSIKLNTCEGEGEIAVPARIINESLKEFADQPLTFNFNIESNSVDILSENGKFTVPCQSGADFPQLPALKKDQTISVALSPEILSNGINKTLFATADDELRPVMNGIFIEFYENKVIFVASDAHKLVKYTRTDIQSDAESSFIFPKKPASYLKNILTKETEPVKISFDEKNAIFTLSNYKMVCRLVEGNYPSYNSVIPTENPYKLVADRLEFFNALKRVSIFSNQASQLVKLSITGNLLTISAEDMDFATAGLERINCQYTGEPMEIGFKSTFLMEILSNLPTPEVKVELSDPTRAGIILPIDNENENEDILMLLMPMMINI
ncbi:MAG: DNA polymerase III subunit beta [Marinilabiliales bacterium]